MTSPKIRATISYPHIERKTYHWIQFSIPTYGGTYSRGATSWEKECLDAANSFMRKLTSVPGFFEFFSSHNYCVRKQDVISFLNEKETHLVFPETREYHEPFSWPWCQLEEGLEHPGHILDSNGWIFDKAAVPEISVVIDGEKYFPFSNDESCISNLFADNDFAWDVCEASAYNVPELHGILQDFSDKSTAIYECAFNSSYDARIEIVLKYLEEILPAYEIVVDEDTVWVPAGSYPIHIFDRAELHDLIKANKKEIRSILQHYHDLNH